MKVDSLATSLFPGGVNSPVRAYRAVGGEPPALVRGEGPYVWDEAGRRYVDYVGAYGPLILGHANLAVVEAIRAAAKGRRHAGLADAPGGALAARVPQGA